MPTKKNRTRDARTSKPRIKDLPVSERRAKATKGGNTWAGTPIATIANTTLPAVQRVG